MTPRSTEQESVTCEECGVEVPEDDAVGGSGSIKDEGASRLADGETVSASELFAFDEWYCSFDCLVAGDSDG